jgi:O-acetyl-ADP-ribose deacetylase
MRLEAVEGDITTQQLDAIVNAANSSLLGGGGVDGAIHRAAGPRLLEECHRVRATTHPAGLPVGQAVATAAGALHAHWVIHTVGPNRYRGQDDPALLAACFTSSLDVATEVGARSMAFPAVSAGAYGWPMEDVAAVAVSAVRRWSAESPSADAIDLVRFVPFGPAALAAFQAELR